MAKKRHSGGSGTKMQARTKKAATAAPSATATATAAAAWRVPALGAFAALVIGVLVGFAGRNTATSPDIVLRRILEDVDRDDSLINVVMELPLVETDQMKWAEHAHYSPEMTLSWQENEANPGENGLAGFRFDTPDDLKTLSSDAVARETLWIKIQRADAYIKHLMSVAKTLTPLASKELRELFADDYSFLYNQRLSLLRERNNAMQQRFLKEKGRLPVIEDQQVLSIERRSALELSVEDFVNEYAKKRKPVIITDLDLFRTPWTKAYVAEKCDFQKMPLAVNAPMYQGTQHPGELIFIPGGCPHGVRNHDDIVGISMNYLDVSNEWLYLWMKLADHDFRDYELYANPAFPRGLRRDQKDLTFGEFKSQHWYAQSANSFDIK
ncbi:Bifunctional arginine demethylase and lysyl-hydroxylase PSR [Hondaea fermentalgiana]|uniref:Bifunctional arginine demethylase and lysyl-hydroxylase PSR n=1 Tax=Hondaea fermentalgiana TaxID=2315210 RepID=A0A2R5FYV1_9STRA|nr:Bifunctional arginine demethylase and lysyl-hydroxylase PSR [Hondaea fermentalgiana]|eukprot:GBG23936.1 Bifunctional arginine demethylase and lysyl-hydroxylase PSR [Hondaea fermentalgiana]